jgi:hypothetical protein
MKTPVYFYCPSETVVASVPERVEHYWAWINAILVNNPVILADGARCNWDGPYSWTIQTFMHLRESGIRCELRSQIPSRGIIISHSDFWPTDAHPSNEQFFVEIKPDRDKKLRSAQFTICQSQYDPILKSLAAILQRVSVIGYWPQPSLVPRATTSRSIRNAAFIGNRESFLDRKDLLISELHKRNILLHFPPRQIWHDYSKIDLVIAVRDPSSFLPSAARHKRAERKPPNKLINAWLAEVPAILSPEPSYLALKKSNLDFLEASNVSEVLDAIDSEVLDAIVKLTSSPDLYKKMVANARNRGADYGTNAITSQWRCLLKQRVEPLYRKWLERPAERLCHDLVTRLFA